MKPVQLMSNMLEFVLLVCLWMWDKENERGDNSRIQKLKSDDTT